MEFLAILTALGVVCFPMVEWFKSGFITMNWFMNLTEIQQSWVLRSLAALLGVGAALLWQADAFALVPAMAGADPIVRRIATGLASAAPAEFLHLFAAWLGFKVNATADRPRAQLKIEAQNARGIEPKRTYAGWL